MVKLRLELKSECFDEQARKSKMSRQPVVTCHYWAKGKTTICAAAAEVYSEIGKTVTNCSNFACSL